MNSVIFCNPVILHKFLLEVLNTDGYFWFSASNKHDTTIFNCMIKEFVTVVYIHSPIDETLWCTYKSHTLLKLQFYYAGIKYHLKFIYVFYTITLVNFVCPDAHSDRWSSFGKRVWFTESRTVLVISFC